MCLRGQPGFFCKCQGKYFRLCRPHGLCCNFLTLSSQQDSNHRRYQINWLYFSKTLCTKTGGGLDLFTDFPPILFIFLEYQLSEARIFPRIGYIPLLSRHSTICASRLQMMQERGVSMSVVAILQTTAYPFMLFFSLPPFFSY